MNSKNIFVGALLLAGFFSAPQAHAYKNWWCGGEPVVWNNPFAMVRNTFSIPAGGQREGSLDNAIGRWRGVIGMEDMVSKSPFVTTGSTIWHFNFQNDAAVVPRSNIGGNNGLTQMFHDGCFFGGDAEWIEADVMVASDLGFAPVGETTLGTSGRLTFLHELGHAHGLNHDQRYNHMRATQPRPRVGGTGETVDVLPDDAKGGRFLYPTGNKEINLFASAHRRRSNDTIVANNTGTATVCSKGGDSLTFRSTVGNNGTVNLKQTERWWVSKSGQAHNGVGGIEIGDWANGTFLANVVNTRELTFKLPALPAGTYFLYHGVDMLDEHDESREDDNVVREVLMIQVNNC